MLLAYFGPDTIMPLTSALAAVVGFFLMFGRQVGRFLLLVVAALARRLPSKAKRARSGLRADGPTTARPKRTTTRPEKVRT